MLAASSYFRKLSLSLTLVLSLLSEGAANTAPIYGYKIVAKYPHSTDSYTEGFF